MNDVEKSKEEEFDDVISKLPEQQREVILNRMRVVLAEKSYSGPLPAPEDMNAYEQTLPGAANRIITIFEKQVDHRIKQEGKIVNNENSQVKRGQYLGFILCFFFGGIASYLAITGHEILAGVIFGTLIVALCVIFVLNRYPAFMNKNDA